LSLFCLSRLSGLSGPFGLSGLSSLSGPFGLFGLSGLFGPSGLFGLSCRFLLPGARGTRSPWAARGLGKAEGPHIGILRSPEI